MRINFNIQNKYCIKDYNVNINENNKMEIKI